MALVVVSQGERRRWRGVTLSAPQYQTSNRVQLWLGAGFILRESEAWLEVKLFDASFGTLLDKSSAYQSLRFRQLPNGRGVVVEDRRGGQMANPQDYVFNQPPLKSDDLTLEQITLQYAGGPVSEPQFRQANTAKRPGDLVSGWSQESRLSAPVVELSAEEGAFVLAWPALPDVTGYRLYCGDQADFEFVPGTGEPVDPGHRISGLAVGTTKYCRVAAFTDAQESAASAPVKLRVPVQLSAPNLAAQVGDQRVLLGWPEVAGALGYRLEYCFDPQWPQDKVQSKQLQVPQFEHLNLTNDQAVYYRIRSIGPDGPGPASKTLRAVPQLPQVMEPSLEEQLSGLRVEEFTLFKGLPELSYPIADQEQAQKLDLQRAKQLEALDFKAREEMIALYLAEGRGDRIAAALQDQLDEEPANLNLSLSLSKVYAEQGDVKTALNVLNASLSRISLSARAALNQELKTQVKEGKSNLSSQSDESFLIEEFAKLGQKLLDEGRYEESLSAFQSLFSLAQDYPMIYYRMGLARRGLSQYNQAKEAFIEQGQQEVALQQLISNLKQLSAVIQKRPDLDSIETARKGIREVLAKNKQAALDADLDDELEELDDLYNELEAARLAGLPDLWVRLDEKAAVGGLQPGQGFYVDLKAGNLGQKSSGAFRVHYRLEHEAKLAFDLQGSDRFEGLKAESQDLRWNKRLEVPVNAPPGNYRLVVHLELDGEGSEVDLANNRADGGYALGIVEPRADLKVALTDQPQKQDLQRGAAFGVKLQIQNQGFLASQAYRVELYLRHQKGQEVNLVTSPLFEPLGEPQASQSWEPSVTLPERLVEGSYHLAARLLDAQGKPLADSEPTQSLVTYRYTAPFIDLGLAWTQPPKDVWVKPGQPFKIQLGLVNQGNQRSQDFAVGYRLIDDQGVEHPLEGLDPFKGLDPAAGPQSWDRELRPGTDLPQGAYRLVARLEGAALAEDRQSANNQLLAPEPVHILPLYRRGVLAQARQELTQRLQTQPSDLSASLGLAHLNAEAKQRVQLLLGVSAYFDQLPWEAQRGLAASLKTPEQAKGVLGDARFAFEDFRNLAAKLAATGESQTALDLLQRLLALVPGEPATASQLAALQVKIGRPNAARQTLVKALALQPDKGLLLALTPLHQSDPRPATWRSLNAGWKAWASTQKQPEEAQQALKTLKPALPQTDKLQIAIRGLAERAKVTPGQILSFDLSLASEQAIEKSLEVHFQLVEQSGYVLDLHQPLRVNRLPKGRQQVNRQVKLPDFLPPGVFRLRAWSEGLAGTTRAQAPALWLHGPANLAIQGFAHHRKGAQIEIQLAWKNLGGGDSSNSRLLLWHHPNEGGEQFLLATVQLPDLAPSVGQRQIQRSFRWEQLKDLPAGRLRAQIQSDGPEGFLALDNQAFSANPLGGAGLDLQLLGVELRERRLVAGQPLNLLLRLQGEPKGAAKLWLQSPQGKILLGNLALPKAQKGPSGEQVYALQATCPDIPAGSYRVALQVDGLEWLASEQLKSGPAKLQVKFVDLLGQDLLPGGELRLKLAIENSGYSTSQSQSLKLSLVGAKTYSLGELKLAPLPPSADAKLIEGRWSLPKDLAQDNYRLLIQGDQLAARSKEDLSVRPLRAESPSEMQVFLPGQAPSFRWSAVGSGKYRLAFSPDPDFKGRGTVLRLDWTEQSEQLPSALQWNLIWSLSQNGNRPLYWRVEGQGLSHTELASGPRRLRLRNRP
ncbi:MAG: hypothetical protein RRB13_01075 [bacterium]|nr:hypothetical protein [bacterium]